MKNHSVSPARRAALLAVGALSLSAGLTCLPALMPSAQAKPKQVLEIWPGQRVLLVLPLTVGPDWNGGPELAEAVKPLVRPSLQQALTDTGKFSITLPYRFDPILRRAVVENRISQDIITPFIDAPSLQTAQPVFTQLRFDQVPMVTQVQLEELRVGGTTQKPTLQMQVSAKLYEIGNGNPFRSIVVTSDPAEGRTPEARLQNAAADAFEQIAEYFVKAPDSFQLPASLIAENNAATAGGNAQNANPVAPTKPVAPVATPSVRPNGVAPRRGAAMIPVLPAGEPPLGIAAGGEKTLDR